MDEILAGMIRTATPVLLAALGGVICEKVGVFNIALEGMMLFGAFFAIYGVFLTTSPAFGILLALLVGAVIGVIYVFIVEKMKADPTIVSIGVNTLAIGVTTYLMKITFGDAGSVGSDRIVGLPKLDIPLLRDIPFLNNMLNGHTPLVYVSIILVVLMHFIVYHTHTGISMRAVGEKEAAAAAAGIKVNRYRFLGVMLCGALCGLAGAHLSLGYVTMFTENMSGGRGFFAYTAVVFGKADPFMVLVASLVFGLAETLAYRAQQFGLPSPLVLTVPYTITLVALIVRNVKIRKNALKNTAKA